LETGADGNRASPIRNADGPGRSLSKGGLEFPHRQPLPVTRATVKGRRTGFWKVGRVSTAGVTGFDERPHALLSTREKLLGAAAAGDAAA
jgi:hypothetical protein